MPKSTDDLPESSAPPQYTPVLGLSDEPPEAHQHLPRTGTVFDQPEPDPLIELTVVVPARNEEASIGACLESLVAQSEDIFELGRDWELIVVDDGSTDRTAEIARRLSGVTVMTADKLKPGWTGKANAIWTAARKARGRWLLFTDADTIHEPGSLRHGIHEATRHKAGMLSYSPRQIVSGLAQRTLMPLIFCELAIAYPPAKVSDPTERIAAANGQYPACGARSISPHRRPRCGARSRAGGRGTRFHRQTPPRRLALPLRGRCRRHANVSDHRRNDGRMDQEPGAALSQCARAFRLARHRSAAAVLPALPRHRVLERAIQRARPGVAGAGWLLALLWLRTLFRFYRRVGKSNFSFADCALSPLGLPLFIFLLYRSWFQHRVLKQVSWKGRRTYGQ